MSIVIQSTPNPNARKFVLPILYFERSMNFAGVESASQMPLARQLFALHGVYNVLLAQDFVTVNKLPGVEWSELELQVLAILRQWMEERDATSMNSSQRGQR